MCRNTFYFLVCCKIQLMLHWRERSVTLLFEWLCCPITFFCSHSWDCFPIRWKQDHHLFWIQGSHCPPPPHPHEEKCPLLLASSFAIFLLFFTSEPLPAPLFSSVQTAVVNSWRLVARESVTPGLEKGRQWTDFLPDSRGHSLPYDREWLPQLPQTDHWTVESLPVQSQRSLNKVFSLGRVSRREMSHQKQNGNNTTGLAQILLKSGLRWHRDTQ